MIKSKLKKITDTCFVMILDNVNYYYFSEACSMLHRNNGPAIEFKNGEQHYYLLGERHRDDGPAIVAEGIKQWWLNGKEYSEEDFNKKKK